MDIATWALMLNGQTAGPTAIGGTAKHPVAFKDGMPVEQDRYNTATEFFFTVDFPGGTQMLIRNDTDNGVLIEGEKGRMFVNRGKLTGEPVEALKDDPLPEGAHREGLQKPADGARRAEGRTGPTFSIVRRTSRSRSPTSTPT